MPKTVEVEGLFVTADPIHTCIQVPHERFKELLGEAKYAEEMAMRHQICVMVDGKEDSETMAAPLEIYPEYLFELLHTEEGERRARVTVTIEYLDEPSTDVPVQQDAKDGPSDSPKAEFEAAAAIEERVGT